MGQHCLPWRPDAILWSCVSRTTPKNDENRKKDLSPIKQFRRLATHFDKLEQNFQATVTIAHCSRWLGKDVHTP